MTNRQTSTPQGEVETALAELREMFPRCSVIVSAYLSPEEYSIAIASEDEYEIFSFDTLAECMGEVRAWKQSTTPQPETEKET